MFNLKIRTLFYQLLTLHDQIINIYMHFIQFIEVYEFVYYVCIFLKF